MSIIPKILSLAGISGGTAKVIIQSPLIVLIESLNEWLWNIKRVTDREYRYEVPKYRNPNV